MREWFSKNSNPIAGLAGLAVVVAGIVAAPPWLSERLGRLLDHVGSDPDGSVSAMLVLLGGLLTAAGLLRAFWQRDPNAEGGAAPQRPERVSRGGGRESGHATLHAMAFVVGAAIAFLAGCSLLSGCTAAQQTQARETLHDVLEVAKPVGKWGCLIARTLCTKSDDVACGIIATACEGFDALVASQGGLHEVDAGGEEEPHTIDEE